MIELEAVGRTSTGNRIVTDAPYILIGRSPASNFIVPDPRVSWHHGEIVFRDRQYLYSDLRSTHGSMIRRGAVDRPVQAARLKEGDLILLAGGDNALRVNCIAANEDIREDFAVTIAGDDAGVDREGEDLFVDDAAVLRLFLTLERALARGDETGRAGMLQALIESLNSLYPELDYAAVLEEKGPHIVLEQSLSLAGKTLPRKSTKICARAKGRPEGFVFEITAGHVVPRSGETQEELSQKSATLKHDTSGICMPLNPGTGARLYVQIERPEHHGKFGRRDCALVHAMTARTEERIRHLDVTQRYNASSQSAALGIFAQTLAHDIKNALTFAPYMKEKLADPGKHADVVRGVETAYQLARSLQSPSRSDGRMVTPFSLNRLAEGIAESFRALFEGRCVFQAQCAEGDEKIIGYGHLLNRTVWNLVINAYNAHENNERVPRAERFVRLEVGPVRDGRTWIAVDDNAGGIPPQTLAFFQHSFAMIREACEQQSDILQVVEMMRREDGAVNRVGLFFTAIAVYDMDGRLEVESTEGAGTRFTVYLPARIDRLKGLLQF